MRIDRSALSKLGIMRLCAPGPATSLQQGDRRSASRGRGVEFADYRPYDPGDDVRLLDWNVYLRHGVPLVRQFHEERSLAVKVCLDTSESMRFGRPRKADHAAQLAASIALVALNNRDPLTLGVFGGDARARSRATNLDGLAEILHVLESLEPGGTQDPTAMLGALFDEGRADRVMLVSDLLYEDELRAAILRQLAAASPHSVVLHVLGSDELRPSLVDVERIIDAETGEEIAIAEGADALSQYRSALSAWLEQLQAQCRGVGLRYVQAFTTKDAARLVRGALRRAQVVEHAGGAH